jgi:hypothetical protein
MRGLEMGLAVIARHVIGCHVSHKTMVVKVGK